LLIEQKEDTQMIETDEEKRLDSVPIRIAEHRRVRAVLESFAYIQPFAGMFRKIVMFYVESHW
jgi:hypothetical protein